jgi:PAS domain-containing protein
MREVESTLTELEATRQELEALRQELERYAAFFEHAPDACVITDAGGSVREANQAALELLGGTRDEIVGRPLRKLIQVELAARPIPLEDGDRGLCWLLRPG